MKSYLTHLECTACGKTHPHAQAIRTCPDCGKVLFARYDLPKARREITPKAFQGRGNSMWRFFELMPVLNERNVVSLGEGGTPLLKAERLGKKLGLKNLYLKDEGLNPTGSFKARGLSAAVSKAKEVGQMRVTIPTAGNAGGALAAYAARGGLESYVFMPKDAPDANKIECQVLGSNLNLVDGLISDAGRISQEKAKKEGLFDLSTLREPYRAEGKKTMALELAIDLGWRAPDAIIYPTGGGTGIVGMHKAFNELRELGWIDSPQPKFVSIQAEGCQPLVKAYREGADKAEPYPNAHTLASGLRVPGVFADYIILKVLRETGGTALPVPDRDMVAAMKELGAAEGVFACPEGAATLAGLKQLLKQNFFKGDETIILMNTGSGLKYLDVLNAH
ncbi:MAG: threonine synthase [SAR202 cluster bacterium]|nr:threonine synthase [SAR202 cluster bacterium]